GSLPAAAPAESSPREGAGRVSGRQKVLNCALHWPSTQVSGVGTPLLATRPSTCGAAEALDAGIPTAAMALRAANSAERSDITKTLPRLAAGDGPSLEASPRRSRAPPPGETVRHKEHGRRTDGGIAMESRIAPRGCAGQYKMWGAMSAVALDGEVRVAPAPMRGRQGARQRHGGSRIR